MPNSGLESEAVVSSRAVGKSRVKLYVFMIGAVLVGGGVFAEQILDTVRVSAPRQGGGDFTCASMACQDALFGVMISPPFPQDVAVLDDEVDGNLVCAVLRTMRPGGCPAASPPLSNIPGFDPNWQPNGCGVGPLSNAFLEKSLEIVTLGGFSYDLNAPVAGVSFKAACDLHDRCWGMNGGFSECNISFRNQMNHACSSLAAVGAYADCLAYAGQYYAAVHLPGPVRWHYDFASGKFECAAWHRDMEANQCSV